MPTDQAQRRLFLAILPTDELRARLADLTERFTKAARFTPVRANWVPAGNFHLTLHFLGGQSPELADALAAELPAVAAAIDPFDIAVRGIGWFPHASAPKVLWAGVPTPPQPLYALRDALTEVLRRHGIDPPHERFHAHITLARIPTLKGTGAFVKTVSGQRFHDCGGMRVEHVHLVESVFDRENDRPRYVPLGSATLGG